MNQEHILKLNDYEHVRKRTEMYLGSRTVVSQKTLLYDNELKPYISEIEYVPAIYTCFREILDNALDEIIGFKSGNKIEVEYYPEQRKFIISDNGRGIPIDYDDKENCYVATMVLTNLRAGRNFNERNNVVGINGIGASAVNFVSSYFRVEIVRNNTKFIQIFTEGEQNLIINPPKIKPIKSDTSGTKIEFILSEKVFKNFILPENFVFSRLYDIALSNPNIIFYYNNKRLLNRNSVEKIIFRDHKKIVINVTDSDFESRFILIPDFTDDEDFTHSIVNNIYTSNNGIHVDHFKKYFFNNLLSSLEKESRKRKLTPNKSDICDNLLIYNVTKLKAPVFDSQTKNRLINEDLNNIFKNFFTTDFFREFNRKNSEWINKIYEKCAERINKKHDNELNKIAKKIIKKKIPKLIDATSSNRSECILFLSEGDSAIAGMSSVRDPKIHAGMPLRGKILNVYNLNGKQVLENKELQDIITAIGLKINEKADRKNLRYGKIYIATDSDPDGHNIAALLINFFYKFWPELFDPDNEPYIYIFLTPYIIAEKNNERKYWYSYNYHQFDPREYKNWNITRAKGLGSLTRNDWLYSLKNIVAFPIIDKNKNLDKVLDLLFNESKADDRKTWIALS